MNKKLSLIISMVIFGSIGLFVKNIAISGAIVSFFRALLGVIVLVLFMLLTKKKLVIPRMKYNLPLLMFSGAVMGFNWVLLFDSYNYTTVANATFIYYMAPMIVLLASPYLLKVRISLKQWLAFGISLLGMYLIMGASGDFNKGTLLAFGAAVLYAAVVLCNKKLDQMDPLCSTVIQLFSAMVVLGVFLAFRNGFAAVKGLDSTSVIFLIIVGLIHTGLAYVLYFSSVAALDPFLVAIYSYIDPLLATLISMWLLGEESGWLKLLGGAMILAGSFVGSAVKSGEGNVQD